MQCTVSQELTSALPQARGGTAYSVIVLSQPCAKSPYTVTGVPPEIDTRVGNTAVSKDGPAQDQARERDSQWRLAPLTAQRRQCAPDGATTRPLVDVKSAPLLLIWTGSAASMCPRRGREHRTRVGPSHSAASGPSVPMRHHGPSRDGEKATPRTVAPTPPDDNDAEVTDGKSAGHGSQVRRAVSACSCTTRVRTNAAPYL